MPIRPLQGQTAIVTGAGRGLGRATAETLAAAGASVVAVARTAAQVEAVVSTINGAGGHAIALAADTSGYAEMERVAREAERWAGPITILVNNAGVLDPVGRLALTDPVSWARLIAVNVIGTYNATRAVLPLMLEHDYGRIVSVSSGVAIRARPGITAYSASKAAIEQLTRSLALELDATRTTACAFRPGQMKTALNATAMAIFARDFPDHPFPAAAGGDPYQPAGTIAFLSSPQATFNGAVLEQGDANLARSVAAFFGAQVAGV